MSTHNTCFHGEIRKISIVLYAKKKNIFIHAIHGNIHVSGRKSEKDLNSHFTAVILLSMFLVNLPLTKY